MNTALRSILRSILATDPYGPDYALQSVLLTREWEKVIRDPETREIFTATVATTILEQGLAGVTNGVAFLDRLENADLMDAALEGIPLAITLMLGTTEIQDVMHMLYLFETKPQVKDDLNKIGVFASESVAAAGAYPHEGRYACIISVTDEDVYLYDFMSNGEPISSLHDYVQDDPRLSRVVQDFYTSTEVREALEFTGRNLGEITSVLLDAARSPLLTEERRAKLNEAIAAFPQGWMPIGVDAPSVHTPA